MPTRFRNKQFQENSLYHIYNRGVEKRLIFQDAFDYQMFQSYLEDYLAPKNELGLREQLSKPGLKYYEREKISRLLRLKNYSDEITLLAFCLMPNHFHFFLKQKHEDSIPKFMRSFCTRYSMYFNNRYKRVGYLYQDIYKSVPVVTDDQFMYLSKYIHKQALSTNFSSYPDYLATFKRPWVNTKEILAYFSRTNPSLSYQSFVEESEEPGPILNITLEEF